MGIRLFCFSIAVSLIAVSLIVPAKANIVAGPVDGYSVIIRDAGDVRLLASYLTPNGIPYDKKMGPEYGLTAMKVEWTPLNIPVQITFDRTKTGYSLLFSSRLRNIAREPLCWKVRDVDEYEVRSVSRFWEKTTDDFRVWHKKCAVLAPLASQDSLKQLEIADQEILQAIKKIREMQPLSWVGDRETYGVATFLPEEVSQNLLDAISSSCNFPASRLTWSKNGGFDFQKLNENADIVNKIIPPVSSAGQKNQCIEIQIQSLKAGISLGKMRKKTANAKKN